MFANYQEVVIFTFLHVLSHVIMIQNGGTICQILKSQSLLND